MSSNEIELYTFPSTKSEALAMLYLQSQNLTNISPEEFAKKYEDVHSKISSFYKNKITSNADSMVDYFTQINSSLPNSDILDGPY